MVEYFNILEGKVDIDKFLDKYNFDYVMVNKGENIYKHIKNDDDYELDFKSKNKITFLFKRKYSQT